MISLKSYYTIFLLILFLSAGIIFAGQIIHKEVLAAGFSIKNFTGTSGLTDTGNATGHAKDGKLTSSPEIIVASIVKLFLSFLGVIFLALTIYGGFNWMLARGNQQKIDKAKSILTNSIIGLIVILAAYSLAVFISRNFAVTAI